MKYNKKNTKDNQNMLKNNQQKIKDNYNKMKYNKLNMKDNQELERQPVEQEILLL